MSAFFRIHLRITPRWKHLTMYIAPVTFLAIFVNIPMFMNVQVKRKKDFLKIASADVDAPHVDKIDSTCARTACKL